MVKVIILLVEHVEINDIEINPSQFVVENSESIYKNYILKEKIGEGTHENSIQER